MQELTIKQSQAFLLLEAINHFCWTVKINVETVTGDFSTETPETEYKIKLDIDKDIIHRINGYINLNSTKK